MTQPGRRKRDDRVPFEKTDCEGRRDGVAAGRTWDRGRIRGRRGRLEKVLGLRRGHRDRKQTDRAQRAQATARSQGSWVHGAIPQRWKGANRRRGWGGPVGFGGPQSSLLPDTPVLGGGSFHWTPGWKAYLWKTRTEGAGPRFLLQPTLRSRRHGHPCGVKDPRLRAPRGVNGVLDEALKARACAPALSLIR